MLEDIPFEISQHLICLVGNMRMGIVMQEQHAFVCAEWCSPGQFVCPNSQVCVDQHQLCDGARDCPYGDDEKQCVTVAQNESTAGGFPYNSEGYLMVRKQGRWGKLCLQNFDNVVARSQSAWEVADLGRAVCKAMTYSDFERVNRTVDTPSSSRADSSHYFELAYSSDAYNNSQPRFYQWTTQHYIQEYRTLQVASLVTAQPTQCNQKEVVHVSCRDLRCGIRPQAINQWASSRHSRIVGGGNAAPGSWPWQAALYKEGEFQCGATLIADRWLVSAGHCFYHALDDYWVARLGALRRGSSFPSPYEQLRPVSHIILHPGYVDAGFLNDISLLRLRDPVQFSDFVRPVCLPPAPIHDGRLCTVVGWGQLFEVGRIFRKSRRIHAAMCYWKFHTCSSYITFLVQFHYANHLDYTSPK
ncbi:transmembrane protease serine 2-like [Cryptotermes secundus]|uniref:transmembrane protease serine 2-like n=1 Tax=Cryptotermes secundus TaxID=105785 RepID=UPI001454B997|nr:transmembrane protease serine 2-like [Cryptotermes secundus]